MKIRHAIIGSILFISSCVDKDRHGIPLDTPTSGHLKMAIDKSLYPLLDAEVIAFQSIYKNATIDPVYLTESEAVDALLKDSVKIAVVTRKLSAEEKDLLWTEKILPQQITIAREGIALIVNPDNPDTLLSTEQLKRILLGEAPSREPVDNSSPPDGLVVVFNQPGGGIIRYLKDSVVNFSSLPAYCYAVNSDSAVIDYVTLHKKSIGLIGTGWISDTDDASANRFLQKVRVVAIARDKQFYKPYQAYVAQGSYPLIREVVILSREARTGLASGFIAFSASDKGQRIVLKAGLVPVTMPVRIVEINHEPL